MERELYYSEDREKVIVVSPVSGLYPLFNKMKRFKYDNLLVVGNGFDLNLGLPTTFRNFVESMAFKRMYVRRIQEKRLKKKVTPSLIDFLYGKKFIERWYDVEAALLEYVSRRADGNFVNNVKEDKRDYELVCKALIKYLARLFKGDHIDSQLANKMMDSAASQILKIIKSERNILYSFNYTPIHFIIKIATCIDYSTASIVRPHGKITEDSIINGKVEDNTIILGIETDDINVIAPGYSFLLKSNNPTYKSTNLASDLLNAHNVIIFGHSLNKMDFGYFREYFSLLTSNVNEDRKLTIITKDDNSKITLLDNLRKEGISVRDMFAHVSVEIILTDDIGKKNTESEKLFNKLLEETDTDWYM